MNVPKTTTTTRYVHALIAPTARPEDTTILKLYGNRFDRETDLLNARQNIITPPAIQHVWWPWHRTPRLVRPQPPMPRITASTGVKILNLAVIAASMFVIGVVIYHIWSGQA